MNKAFTKSADLNLTWKFFLVTNNLHKIIKLLVTVHSEEGFTPLIENRYEMKKKHVMMIWDLNLCNNEFNLKSAHSVFFRLISQDYEHAENENATVFNDFNHFRPSFVSVVSYVAMSGSRSKSEVGFMKLLN